MLSRLTPSRLTPSGQLTRQTLAPAEQPDAEKAEDSPKGEYVRSFVA